MRGSIDESRQRFEASLALARAVGRSDLVAQIRLSLGVNALVGDDPDGALKVLEEARDFFRAAGDRLHLADALVSIAIAHRLLSQSSSGRAAYREALRLSSETNNLAGIGSGLLVGSAVESSSGRHLEAARMLGAADALRETTGASAPQMSSVVKEVEEAARRSESTAAVDEALEEGRRMTVAQAVEYAESLAD